MAAMALFTSPVVADIKDDAVERRAIEAAVWGMSIVNFQAMRDVMKQDAGVGFNDVAYNSKVQTWRLKTTTNNNTTPYIFIFWNVKDGPVVVEIPPSSKDVGLFGTLMDAWQRPLEDVGAKGKDQGRGAKYLIGTTRIPGAISPRIHHSAAADL